ncbi:MAG: protein translocase subunit SecD [Nakamurella sp.]
MASPVGQFRPWRLITAFVLVTAVLYALVFFTKGSNSPKLGIDLQGGTQVTLTAQTADGKDPSTASMQQAQEIMTRRVNGSGFAGVQVQIDGANHLVITVPGNKPLTGLYGSAKMNIRPDLTKGPDYTALRAAAASASTATGTAATGTGATRPPGAGSVASGAATSGSKPGTTRSSAPASGAAASSTKPAPALNGSSAATGAPTTLVPTSPVTTSVSGQGLRAVARATVSAGQSSTGATSAAKVTSAPTQTPAAATTPSPALIGPVVPSASASSPTSATGSANAPASGAGTVSGTAASTAAASGTATSAPSVKKSAWPLPGSDKANPNQPAAATAAAWAAWVTAARTAVQSGGISCDDIKPTQGIDVSGRPLLACGSGVAGPDPNQWCAGEITTKCVVLTDTTLIPGDQIDSAAAAFDPSGSAGWVINVKFDSQGFGTWSSYTSKSENLHQQTAFVLDGVVISDPQINGPINTVTTQISGNFTQQTATDLSNSLNFGALPLSFKPGTATSISAELGFQYLQAGLIAGGIGLLLVVLYCLLYYRLLGLITIGSLILSGGLVYAIMVLLGRWVGLSLDLAGVAGLIVAIGITADSFVIYFERLKDEVREGRSFRSAVPRGWERAKRTILSADAVSILSAVILYLVAVGDVKGFAFTLGLSTILDLVVVYLVTHPLVALASGSKIFNSPRLSGLGAVAVAGARQRAATSRLTAKEA